MNSHHSLARIEDDGAVGPAVVIDQTQVRKKTHTHGLQTPLIAQREAITVNLRTRETSF